jgi:hypothetical protein
MTNQELLNEVKVRYPVLYTIMALNDQLLKLLDHGEIQLTEFVSNGKIVRIEAIPKISKKLDNL